MLTEIPKVGDKVRYIGGYFNDYVTLGHEYEIDEVKYGGAFFVDDSGAPRSRSIIGEFDFDCFEIVSEETESSPSIHDLLANLGRRLSDVEKALAPNFHADIIELKQTELDAIETGTSDAVNSPSHYKRGKFETIEVIEEITQGYADGFVAHCAGTAIKYIARAPYKHDTPTEDLRKAAKYLEFAIKRLEAEASE